MKRYLLSLIFVVAVVGCGGDEPSSSDSEVFCAPGWVDCGAGCIDLQTDASNCGACGTICPGGTVCQNGLCEANLCNPPCAAGESCINGVCQNLLGCNPPCGVTETCSNGVCVPTSEGPCVPACAAGQTCAAGVCQCDNGMTACGAVCVDVLTDGLNCGDCGVACGAGTLCSQGVCVATCPVGSTACGSSCVDTQLHPLHCGACDRPCAADQVCQGGSCVCQAGLTLCAGVCTETRNDAANCGACGVVCTGGKICAGGGCWCDSGMEDCNGTCVAAGTCANPCVPACQLGRVCVDGVCSCDAGLTDCFGTCSNLATDAGNCGACGTQCTGGKTCTNSLCTCPVGQEDCNGTCVATGTCVVTGCTPACAGGKVCENSVCVCPAGQEDCNGTCVAAGTCTTACSPACTGGKVCENSVCVCPAGQEDCNGTCVAAGTCTTPCDPACTGGMVCNNGVCECPAGQTDCSGTCADLQISTTNCGVCGTVCPAGQVCTAGVCGCDAGQVLCNGDCITGTSCPTTGCTRPPGMISDFEDESLLVIDQPGENWDGEWEDFSNDSANGSVGTQTLTIESIGSEECNQFALHTTGSGWGGWVGIGVTVRGTGEAPVLYDASGWTGIRFRARAGSTSMTPVRFNVSTPWTEGEGSGGTCVEGSTPETYCYNHVGRFLYQENQLTTEWQTYHFCFDRDLYPLFVPSNLNNAQRRDIASNFLKLQFQFNKAKNLPELPQPDVDYDEYDSATAFDFWVDDVEFTNDPCPETTFASTGSPAFPRNENLGSCAPATDAEKFNSAIVDAYLRWRSRFVESSGGGYRVESPEATGDHYPSEAEGYGMLITAAMGDQTYFDGLWTYVQSQLENGVMRWAPSGSGSATDADADIAFALILAQSLWGGSYESQAATFINAMAVEDITNNNINPGSNWEGQPEAYNPSYFAPAFYPAFARVGGSVWSTVTTNGYNTLSSNASQFNDLFTDWCNASNGQPRQAGDFGAQVTGNFTAPVYGFDAARVPWRLGVDACANGRSTGQTLLSSLLSRFASLYNNGDSIDLIDSGFYAGPSVAANAYQNQIAFIGPVGVGAMAVSSHANMRDRAFRAVLDIIENSEYNRTYYPTTLGLITLLTMSGNMPNPG
jgi:endo-1,4-beta-D-glucanase Y